MSFRADKRYSLCFLGYNFGFDIPAIIGPGIAVVFIWERPDSRPDSGRKLVLEATLRAELDPRG